MPKRTDLKKIFLIGSGPIVIGQACEFDYSGTQACKALKEEGYQVVLVNSNPATIMTDPEMADRVYVEPITPEICARIIEEERPDALLPTMGGQTALNTAIKLAEMGVLEQYGVELIGASVEAINKAEDRELFKHAMARIGLFTPTSGTVRNLDEGMRLVETIGYPAIIRPSFTLGGTGGNIAYNVDEYRHLLQWGLSESPVGQVLVEQSVIGWKEFELEVMRDRKDNVVIICSIENIDPMGVHTGDSITVAPIQTLTDREYQRMRDAAIAIIREIGVDTGGSNIQFATNPRTGEMVVIEMNPRVSRSSALASKATGFPIAKIAAKLAIGYSLDELPNDITRKTPASFEPTLDYVVVKVPRFAFEKFPGANDTLTTQMKSVGEAMSMGRTFKEAFQKALRSLEIDWYGWGGSKKTPLWATDGPGTIPIDDLRKLLREPKANRMESVRLAFAHALSVQEISEITQIDPWFLSEMADLFEAEQNIARIKDSWASLTAQEMKTIKALGYSDRQLAHLWAVPPGEVTKFRHALGVRPVYKRVDTCAAEFEAETPYFYGTYDQENESIVTDQPKVIILGGGPNRIGQGIEFDYCCVHAALALREIGFETIMVNCNPETVSTDYDISDRLYFEPLTEEDVLHIVQLENPIGVIVQFGGQTPLKLAVPLVKAGVPILGTSSDAIDRAEDRRRFTELVNKLGLRQPDNGSAHSHEEALAIALKIGFPVLVRPSYVLGGRGMQIVFDHLHLERYIEEAAKVSPEHPVLIDKYLEDAIEIDVDALCDGTDVLVAGIMEHIEEAGIHSGDSTCVLPPYSLVEAQIAEIREQTRQIALELGVIGLLNIQFALRHETLYVLEVNPRASRTVPFVSKALGVPLAKVAAKIMAGKTLRELNLLSIPAPGHVSVKEPAFPFVKFPGTDCSLGPEMKSTGEVMGIGDDFGSALARAMIAVNYPLPVKGTAFLSVANKNKRSTINLARHLAELGFHILATTGTARVLNMNGIKAETVLKVSEGRPNIADRMTNGEVVLVVNTVEGRSAHADAQYIRESAIRQHIPYFTTIHGAYAAISAIAALHKRGGPLTVRALQDCHKKVNPA